MWLGPGLLADEKLRVFDEGRDDEILHYDGGEFYQWLKDCEAGAAVACVLSALRLESLALFQLCNASLVPLNTCCPPAAAALCAGDANPEDGFCYPLVVQDQDMRTLLEIKPLGEAAADQQQQEHHAIRTVAKGGPIRVPQAKVGAGWGAWRGRGRAVADCGRGSGSTCAWQQGRAEFESQGLGGAGAALS